MFGSFRGQGGFPPLGLSQTVFLTHPINNSTQPSLGGAGDKGPLGFYVTPTRPTPDPKVGPKKPFHNVPPKWGKQPPPSARDGETSNDGSAAKMEVRSQRGGGIPFAFFPPPCQCWGNFGAALHATRGSSAPDPPNGRAKSTTFEGNPPGGWGRLGPIAQNRHRRGIDRLSPRFPPPEQPPPGGGMTSPQGDELTGAVELLKL